MTKEDYKNAASAISDLRWILAATLSSAKIEHTKESKARMKELEILRMKLEEQCFNHPINSET